MEHNELWSSVLKEMEKRISRTNFSMWLKSTTVAHLSGDTLGVAVDNAFAKSWVEDKYEKDILGIVRTLNPEVKHIEVVISSSTAPAPKRPVKANVPVSSMQLDLKIDAATGLNTRYTLDSFIVGQSNELAHAAALAIVDDVGTKYNPFFVYGGVGLGKTHLIQAIGNEIRKRNPALRPQYMTSEKFTHDVVWSIRNRRTDDMRKKYREADVLIIDDIQFIGGKDKTEEEFFHTFNALHEMNKQIIISSDRPPYAIPTLEERLRSRFEGGLIADITAYDFETRVAIIRSKLDERSSHLGDDVVEVIARKMKKSVRELEGILTKLLFFQEKRGREVTAAIAEEIIEKTMRALTKPVTDTQVISAVAEVYNIATEDLVGRSRRKEIVEPRQVAMFLLRDMLDLSYPTIGEKLGRDHTTAIHSYEKIAREADQNAILNQKIFRVRELLSKH
jgi:chromosomal replication initiator protein